VVCVPAIAYHYAADNWTIGSIACKLSQYLTYVTTYVTVYTLVAVAIVRVCKVRSTARSNDEHRHSTISATAGGCCHRSIRQVSLVVAALWIVALTANLPVIFAYSIKTFVSSTPLNASDIEPYKYCGGPVASTRLQVVQDVQVLRYRGPRGARLAHRHHVLCVRVRRAADTDSEHVFHAASPPAPSRSSLVHLAR